MESINEIDWKQNAYGMEWMTKWLVFLWCRDYRIGRSSAECRSRRVQPHMILFHYENPYTIGIPICVIYSPCHTYLASEDRFHYHLHFPLKKIARPRVDTISKKPWCEWFLLTCPLSITYTSGGIWRHHMVGRYGIFRYVANTVLQLCV